MSSDDLHCTRRSTRLLTEGGTPLLAMQRYEAAWARVTLSKVREGPLTLVTGTK